MKHFTLTSLFIISFLLLTAERCSDGGGGYVMPDSLFTTWIHSHEEDTEGRQVYRRTSYNFPPSRGRERFDIKADGDFLYYGIAPNDGAVDPIVGKWDAVQERAIEINLPENKDKEFAAELIEVSNSRLIIRKLPGKF